MRHPTKEQITYMAAHSGDNREPWYIALNTLCLAVACVAVGLRIASRTKLKTKIGLDDWLIIVAMLMLIANVTCSYVAAYYGMGKHIIFVSDLKSFSLASLAVQTFYSLCIGTIKLSILSLYARIFRRANAWFIPTLWITAIFIFLVVVPQVFVHAFHCVPRESLWTDLGPGQEVYCIDFSAAIVAFGIINIVTDWWILTLPLPVILSLQLDRRTKWSTCSLFLIGFFVCIISIVRLFYAKLMESSDPSWDYVPIFTISTAECSVGILAACMPTWRPLFRFLNQRASSFFSSHTPSRHDLTSLKPLPSQSTITTDTTRGRIYSTLPQSRSSSQSQIIKGDMRMSFHDRYTAQHSRIDLLKEVSYSSYDSYMDADSKEVMYNDTPKLGVGVEITVTPLRSPPQTQFSLADVEKKREKERKKESPKPSGRNHWFVEDLS